MRIARDAASEFEARQLFNGYARANAFLDARHFRFRNADLHAHFAVISNDENGRVLSCAARCGGGNECSGIDKAARNHTRKWSNNLCKTQKGFNAVKIGFGDLPLCGSIIQCLRDYQIRGFGLGFTDSIIIQFGHVKFRFGFGEVRDEFGHFDISEEISFLH